MVILRVDDRLIHGQVIAGWVRPLGIEKIILASDIISKDEWACNAYRLAIPEEIEFVCTDLISCVRDVAGANKKKIMIVVESLTEASELVKKGLSIKEVNVGGIGYKEGSREIAPYIFLSPDDIKSIVYLHQKGIKIIGKQLPNSMPVYVVKKLAGMGR
ncbi:hypothetical protein BXT86_04290 [candidate division WOR-3 bacterium 4484_100]|uniref:PTS EIIB type-4 domain-containing protein n=1 Tax=candidate division WOR-3 bacterium 4484_100 TaxID=1936077 RepID=A0A1V4QER1_UNCW3|nr:MAG: hypothetical protein BXT86_04290 [candidate division WOR-3 bacterium 4484_100]